MTGQCTEEQFPYLALECMQVIPILRAGLIMLEQAATMLPASQTYHVGFVRDENTLEVSH